MCVYLHMHAHSCIGKSLMAFHLNINNNYQSEILRIFPGTTRNRADFEKSNISYNNFAEKESLFKPVTR